MISVTPEALHQFRQMSEDRASDLVIRLYVRSVDGRMRYGMAWGQAEDSDIVLEGQGVCLHVEEMSAPFLAGAEIAYLRDESRQGFSIRVPKAEAGGCGCGRGTCGCGAR